MNMMPSPSTIFGSILLFPSPDFLLLSAEILPVQKYRLAGFHVLTLHVL